jgi:predicted ribosome quality control (RQC) complex YloA/Tae2 family protein
MALDGILLHKIVPELQKSLPLRIQKIWQISNTEVLFQVHGNNGKQQLLISTHSEYNRLLFTNRSYPTPKEPGNFVMILRKYLEGSIIESIEQAKLDRWCTFSIRRHNTLGDIEHINLYVELMGKYANIILVDTNGKIIDALKRIPPFENQKRIIQPNAMFVPTEPQEKKDPFIDQTIDESLSLTKQFSGFSPFLSKEIEYRMSLGESFKSIMNEIEQSDSLYIANDNENAVFHCIELKSIGTCKKYPLFEAFDILYFHKEEKERIKSISGDIYHFVKKELKHQTTKLPRLYKSFDEAKDCEKWKVYGDLLYSYNVQDTKGMNEITLESWEDGSEVKVPLDPKLDGKSNARKCFQKYNKFKKGQIYLQEQIDICENEIHYFEGLLEQLDMADFETALEIKEELIKQKYISDKTKKNPKKKKKENGPKISSIVLPNGISVSYGKNNLQNEALTWHIARKNEYWFHAQGYHGAHVVVHSDHMDEDTIRNASMIAAYFSKGRYSSSVPVQYCLVKELKRIPGAKPGMVSLSSYKTIYIDPDDDHLKQLGIVVS